MAKKNFTIEEAYNPHTNSNRLEYIYTSSISDYQKIAKAPMVYVGIVSTGKTLLAS